MSEATAANRIPERDSFELATLLWRGLAADLSLELVPRGSAAGGAPVEGGDAPHEFVSAYLRRPAWGKWVARFDLLSAVEMAMLVEIAAHNREELRERHGRLAVMLTFIGTFVASVTEVREWLASITLLDLMAVANGVMILLTYALLLRMKASELEACVKLGEARRRARADGGAASPAAFDVAAFVADVLPRIARARRSAWLTLGTVMVLSIGFTAVMLYFSQ